MNTFYSRVLVVIFALALVSSCSSVKPGGGQLAPIDLTPTPGPAGQGLPGGGAAGGPGGGGGTNGGGIAPPAPSVDPAPDFDPKSFLYRLVNQDNNVQCVNPNANRFWVKLSGLVEEVSKTTNQMQYCCTGLYARLIDDFGDFIDVEIKNPGSQDGVLEATLYAAYSQIQNAGQTIHRVAYIDVFLLDPAFTALQTTQGFCPGYCSPSNGPCPGTNSCIDVYWPYLGGFIIQDPKGPACPAN